MNSFLFVTIICAIGCASVIAEMDTPVPLVFWKQPNDSGFSKNTVPALFIYGATDVQQMMTDNSNEFKSPIVIFVIPSFCPEDLRSQSNGAPSFRNLAAMKHRMYVPAASKPLDAIKQMNKTALYTSVETTNVLSKANSGQQITYVEMPLQYDDEPISEFYARVDRIMAGVAESMVDSHTMFLLTGIQCNRNHEHSRKRRDVDSGSAAAPRAAAADKQEPQILKDANLLVYITDVTLYQNGQIQNVQGLTLSVSDVKADTLKAELKGTGLTIAFGIQDWGSTWVVQNILVNGKEAHPSKRISAPLGFSYKCSPMVNITVADMDANKVVLGVGIRGLQIQPKFGAAGDSPLKRFGDANDCTGFTSIGIWSGLIVSFLLLGIMTIGITWILDIRSMDRFDDPKGESS